MRQREPFYKKSHKAWYVQLDGRQVPLGRDEKAAWEEYHRLMAGKEPATDRTPAIVIMDRFLGWVEKNRAENTFRWYKLHCKSFAAFIGPKRAVSELKPYHVTEWLERKFEDCSPTYLNGAVRAVVGPFSWAKKQGLLDVNPIAGCERPAAEPRECYLTPEQWSKAIAMVKPDDPFADFLWFLRETGARPHEARICAGKHWDRKGRRIILERRNSKGKTVRRVIRLNDKALAIVTRRALKYPEGALFRNKIDNPWAKGTLICRFRTMRKQLDFPWFPYVLRHTFCTDALLRGVDPLTVAHLMGHKDASMVFKVYSHLAQQDEFLQAKLKQATGEDVA